MRGSRRQTDLAKGGGGKRTGIRGKTRSGLGGHGCWMGGEGGRRGCLDRTAEGGLPYARGGSYGRGAIFRTPGNVSRDPDA